MAFLGYPKPLAIAHKEPRVLMLYFNLMTIPPTNGETPRHKFFDTFTGIGGFSIPLIERGWECVGFSEVDKYASSIYQHHFPTHHNYGDITRIDAATLPDFDLLCGGFPCQAFSVAGKRRGFLDTRGTLFFDVCRIAKEKRPGLLLLENVKGLLNHDGGETFRVILSALDELGYDAEWQVCNSRHFGVPQNRERVYIAGHLRGEPRPQVFPLTNSNGSPHEEGDEQRLCAGTLSTKNQSPQCQFDGSTVLVVQRERGNNPGSVRSDGVAPTMQKGFGDGNVTIARTIRVGGNGSPHRSRQNWDSYEINGRIRRLTPIECERLQGFPDGWTAIGTEGPISDTQRYKTLGNAVTVNVVREIVQHLDMAA